MVDAGDQESSKAPAVEQGGLSVPERPIFRPPPPRGSLLG